MLVFILFVAIGVGAMTVSHANDSFFWVKMDVSTAYRSYTVATLLQGVITITIVAILSLVLL